MEQMVPTEPTPAPLAAAPAKQVETVPAEESPAHVCIHCLKEVDGTETICPFGWCRKLAILVNLEPRKLVFLH